MSDVPSSPPAQPPSVLLLGEAPADWIRWLEEHARVRRLGGPEEIQNVAREGALDFIICPISELLPMVAAAARDHSRAVLDGVPQGVCSVARDGTLIWSNAALQSYPSEVAEAIRAVCARFVSEMAAPGAERTRRQVAKVGGFVFDLTGSAVPEPGPGIDRVVAIVWDITSMSRLREKLDAIDAAGRQLIALDVDATRLELPERLQLLEDKVIRYCRELLQFEHFDVFVIDRQTNRLDVVLAGGILKSDRWPKMFAQAEGNGICGYVAATGRSYICPDIRTDPRYLPGLDCAASSLTVPLRLNDQVVGVLNVESDQPARFTDEDRQFAEIFAHYIATALHMLKLLVVERSETTGQLAADVRAELTEPLSDIVAEATSLLQGGQVSGDATGRIRAILDHVERVRSVLQTVGKPSPVQGLLGVAEAPRSRLAGKRVLVADDETIIRETVADLLEKAGAMPMLARDGNAAIAMLKSQPFDLVLSDIKMPYKNGYEVFAAAKEANPKCPVILITGFGYDPEHSIVRASHEGLAGVLFKPFKVEQLLELIDKALAPTAPQ